MSKLGTSQVDDKKALLDGAQDSAYSSLSRAKGELVVLYNLINAADIDAWLTKIHGDDAAAKIAYKNAIKTALMAAQVPVNNLVDALKPE